MQEEAINKAPSRKRLLSGTLGQDDSIRTFDPVGENDDENDATSQKTRRSGSPASIVASLPSWGRLSTHSSISDGPQEDRLSPNNSADFPPTFLADQQSSSPSQTPMFVEGMLSIRKGQTSNNTRSWRQSHVVLDLQKGGSLSCYNLDSSNRNQRTNGGSRYTSSVSRLQRTRGHLSSRLSTSLLNAPETGPLIHLPPTVIWMARDIQNNSNEFIIEIYPEDTLGLDSSWNNDVATYQNMQDDLLSDDLKEDLERAQQKGKVFTIHFRCCRRSNEKTIWLKAFERLDRLSQDIVQKRGLRKIFGTASLAFSHSRVRSPSNHLVAMERKFLDGTHSDDSVDSLHKDAQTTLRRRVRDKGEERKEYLVYPFYAYPNQWMIDKELYHEMMKTSATFHDLRNSNSSKKEIGFLKVEILQCIGLPALDFASKTDAVVYMVCGSNAFTSDVIWNKLNPMWLRRSRRACIFPLHHAYARLYVGVFDDDGKNEKDDFAGRVVIDIARLRPRSTFDVTLPLRLSANVYCRRPRGSIRLRLSLDYHSDRDALLSYIPKCIGMPTAKRPDDDVTVLCGDEKAFRNVAITVHGMHMPGGFTLPEWRATIREANFVRKVTINTIIDHVAAVVLWRNPILSLMVFLSWMHCVYRSSIALIPVYGSSLLFVIMVQNYAFYGSTGPIQNGFIPPSLEELAISLFARGEKAILQPLKTTPRRKSCHQSRSQLSAGVETKTYRQRLGWLFRLFGFETTLPSEDFEESDYDMEFPFARGLRDLVTYQSKYPKFTVKESIASRQNTKGTKDTTRGNDQKENTAIDTFNSSTENLLGQSHNGSAPRLRLNQFDSARQKLLSKGPTVQDSDESNDRIPSRFLIPEQDADAKVLETTKKKLEVELADFCDNVHRATFHSFHDRTHRILRKDARYFGGNQKTKSSNLDLELQRLLNTGQFSTANPVVARVGIYMQPMMNAIQCGLSLSRAIYNIFTWRDPFLSFWVTFCLLVIIFVLSIFPWRLFFFLLGLAILGPQNWIFRKRESQGKIPRCISNFLERQRKPRDERRNQVLCDAHTSDIPAGQSIIFSHTSDNSPPVVKECDPREVHEVCVPYSQMMYQRMYDWPPEPAYARCVPTTYIDVRSETGERVARFRPGLGSPDDAQSSDILLDSTEIRDGSKSVSRSN